MSMVTTRRLISGGNNDTEPWVNDTGADTVNNQLVFIPAGTNKGKVGICIGAIANGAEGQIINKGVFELPKAAVAFTQGFAAQASTSATSLTLAGTTSGLYGIGEIRGNSLSSAGYANVDLNAGTRDAFYVW